MYNEHDIAGVKEGDVLAGKYRIDRVLGVGGMGVVVAAHHLDDRVAIKFMLPHADMDMTKTNAMMGSPLYMSPEQMQSPKGWTPASTFGRWE